MKKTAIKQPISAFEGIKRTNVSGEEYWYAKDLAKMIGYADIKEFLPVVEKAKLACQNSGQHVANHFENAIEVRKTENSKGIKSQSIKLSRYACYLAILNADPAKERVAKGQTYFATQARIEELRQNEEYIKLSTAAKKRVYLRQQMIKHNISLFSTVKNAGVIHPNDYAIFQNHGYMGLYGGLDANDIRIRRGLKKSQNILDHMGNTELALNLARATQTEEKLKKRKIQGVNNASKVHFDTSEEIRQSFIKSEGILPEDLPVQEDISSLVIGKKNDLRSENKNKTQK